MATASVTVRVDEDTKRAAANIVEDFGFDLSSVTRAFYRQIVREQRIPLTLEYPTPNLESREAIRETKELIGRSGLRHRIRNVRGDGSIAVLRANYTPRFQKDVKRLKKKHVALDPLKEVVELVVADTPDSRSELVRRHNMHRLKGEWSGSMECHVANAGDWLLVWAQTDDQAYFQRTGGHDDLFSG